MILTHSQLRENPHNAIADVCPTYVIMYDPDISVIRELEAFQSTLPYYLRVYFLCYDKSVEEHRYVTSLNKDKTAFEKLITTKEHLVVALPDDPFELEREIQAEASFGADLYDLSAVSTAVSSDTRTLMSRDKNKLLQARKIVVDVREFRSALPSMLHQSTYAVVPRTITVGDYILAPDICVERKGISDLFQSFQSGRLFNQAEAMIKHYAFPSLLIEFSAGLPTP